MDFTRSDYENMKLLKEKLGTWSDTYDYLGIAPRTAYRIRRRFKENPDLNIYNMKADNAEMVEKRLDFLVDKSEEEINKIEPVREISKNKKTLDKYNITEMSGIPSLSYDDFAYYDEQDQQHKAGEFSNLPKGTPISKAKYRQIRGASLRQIRKLNKAMHFKKQQGVDSKTAYERANKWDQKYYEQKRELKNIAFKDSNGRWHWGPDGKGKRGDYAKVEEVRKLYNKKGVDIDGKIRDQIGKYIDKVFALEPSP